MLYKKIHRQHLREWRVGRRFKYKVDGRLGGVYQVHTGRPQIVMRRIRCICVDSWCIIDICDGRFTGRDRIEWLD